MSEINEYIDAAIDSIRLVLNDLYSVIELDNNAYSTMNEVYKELFNVKQTLETLKSDVSKNSNVIDSKRSYLGI